MGYDGEYNPFCTAERSFQGFNRPFGSVEWSLMDLFILLNTAEWGYDGENFPFCTAAESFKGFVHSFCSA